MCKPLAECAPDEVAFVDRAEMTKAEFRAACASHGFEPWGGSWLHDMQAQAVGQFRRYGCVIERRTGKVFYRESLARALELRAKDPIAKKGE